MYCNKFKTEFNINIEKEKDGLNKVFDFNTKELVDLYKKTVDIYKKYNTGVLTTYAMLQEDISALSEGLKNCIIFLGYVEMMKHVEKEK